MGTSCLEGSNIVIHTYIHIYIYMCVCVFSYLCFGWWI